jgi:DNA adenine methylase
MTGIVLDPPYGEGEVDYSTGGNRTTIAQDVREWALANGDNPGLRIALCGYDGQHEMPSDWTVKEWRAAGGYSSTARQDTQGKANRHRERVWFSPACIGSEAFQLVSA